MESKDVILINEKFKGLTTLMNAQFIHVNERLNDIEKQVNEINGYISDMEERVNQIEKGNILHLIECPQVPKIRVLEDNQLTSKAIKKLIIGGIATTGAIMSIILVVVELFLKNN